MSWFKHEYLRKVQQLQSIDLNVEGSDVPHVLELGEEGTGSGSDSWLSFILSGSLSALKTHIISL